MNNYLREIIEVDYFKPPVFTGNLYDDGVIDKILTVSNEFSHIVTFLLDRFEYKLDNCNIICTEEQYVDDYGNPVELDYDLLIRVKLDDKQFMILDRFDIPVDPKQYSRDVVFFDPINNGKIAKSLFGNLCQRLNIEIAFLYYENDTLNCKDSNGNLLLRSDQFFNNLNLHYLDLIFKLHGMFCDLTVYDIIEEVV